MNIEVEGKYRIRTFDSSNIVLEVLKDIKKKDKNTGEITTYKKWVLDGYFGKVEHACNHLLQAKLKDSSVTTIKEMKECLHNAISTLTDKTNKIIGETE